MSVESPGAIRRLSDRVLVGTAPRWAPPSDTAHLALLLAVLCLYLYVAFMSLVVVKRFLMQC